MGNDVKPHILNQLRELSMLMIRSRTQVARLDGRGIYGGGRGRAAARPARRHERLGGPGAALAPEDQGGQIADGGGADSAVRGQGRVLLTLTLQSTVSQRDLATILGLSRQALGQLLGKLESKGYISRQPSIEDKRVAMVQITEKGRKAASQLHDSLQQDADIFDCLNEEELAEFSGYLNRIIDNIERKHPEDDFVERRKMMREAMREFRRANRQERDQ
ncbi:MarR family winged helix-turn-helix transcriptional regulator [Bifidobacterium psychraerophilum]|uniref:MarR family winged helix-turn-helix transcriptional regulator n=1 Tax=Bifidobacterium psychraerophilum TaxID=218140 RepID=UPI0039ECF130